ncbi:MAG: hypothetical protein QF918_11905 [Pirellulaceae bacterium]|jgi:hypothetical protein|nr:hypothetical protein [Planctomycetaceae bacterium]MDP6468439.1 hypothetical protein [Pirellulaceae bacterium]MDP6554602.1 hypothetical protein [Pirellulaceae bacterium]
MVSAIEDKLKSNKVDNRAFGYSTGKRRVLIFLLAYDVSLAVIRNFMPEDDRVLDYVVGLPVLIPVIIWCHIDAKERKHKIGIFMKLSLVFLFVIAFPIYIFQTQGPSGFKTFTFAIFFTSGTVVLLFLRFF